LDVFKALIIFGSFDAFSEYYRILLCNKRKPACLFKSPSFKSVQYLDLCLLRNV